MKPPLVLAVAAALILVIAWVAFGPEQDPIGPAPASEPEIENEEGAPREAETELPSELAETEAVEDATQRTELTDVDLATVPEQGPPLRVRVIDANGEAVEGAELLMRDIAGAPGTIGDSWATLFGRYGRAMEDSVTDAKGEASLQLSAGGSTFVLIGAQTDGAIGVHHVERAVLLERTEPFVIQLEAAQSITVRLLRENGDPLPDEYVYWWESSDVKGHSLARRKTNAEGLARFAGLERLHRKTELIGTHFGVMGLYVDRPIYEIGAEDLARGTIDLTVPDTGAIELKMQHEDGSDVSPGAQVFASFEFPAAEDDDRDWFFWSNLDGVQQSVSRGVARLEPVQIGFAWQVAVLPGFFADALELELGGPQQAGEVVQHEVLVPLNPMQAHRLRILGPDGQALTHYRVSTKVSLVGEGTSSSSSSGRSTDAEGFILLDLINSDKASSWQLEVTSDAGDPWAWSGTGTVQPEARSHDLPPEIHLTEPPLLVSGEVRDLEGKPITAPITLELGERNAEGRFRELDQVRDLAEAQHIFDFRAFELPQGPLVLRARLSGLGAWVEATVTVGQSGVQLVLPTPGFLQIQATGITAAEADQLIWQLRLPSSAAKPSGASRSRSDDGTYTQIQFGGQSLISLPLAAPAGELLLQVQDPFGRALLDQSFQLQADSTFQEPQREVVPLSLPLQNYRLRVQDTSGEPLRNCTASWRVEEGHWQGSYLRNGTHSYLGTSPPPELRVAADGYVEQIVQWSGLEMTVVLQREL